MFLKTLKFFTLSFSLALPALGQDVELENFGDFEIIYSEEATFRMEVVANGLDLTFGFLFLPDGRALATDRAVGKLYLIDLDNGEKTEISGVPEVVWEDLYGGLLDIRLDPNFEQNGWIYFSYAGRKEGGVTTIVERARIKENSLVDREEIFAARPYYENSGHFSGRLQLKDGYIFIAVGDRSNRERVQNLDTHTGKIIRLFDNGEVPPDNPFVSQAGVLPEIWSYGHRNVQGLVFHPETGVLWEHEHGPRGGDEVNIIKPGRNYGWVTYTYGEEYAGGPVGKGLTHGPGIEQPIFYYKPSIAPSGMEIYSGEAFPGWRGNIFIGALAMTHLNRLVIENSRVINEERLLEDKGWRIRFIRQGPDDLIYVGRDDGVILRLSPVEE